MRVSYQVLICPIVNDERQEPPCIVKTDACVETYNSYFRLKEANTGKLLALPTLVRLFVVHDKQHNVCNAALQSWI